MNKNKSNFNIIIILLLLLFFIYLAIRVFTGIMIANNSNNSNNNSKKEAFSSFNLDNAGSIPKSENSGLLAGVYPSTGRKDVSNKNYSDIWWEYPIFKEGSYKQITNNLQYHDNPDEGTCIRADFCNAFYKNKKVKSNYVLPLPPVPNKSGDSARVNYYWTQPDVLLQPNPDFTLQPL
jgi:hypothetical protein